MSPMEAATSLDFVPRMAFNRREAAKYLGLSLTLLDDLLRTGELKSRAGGKRRVVISRAACDAWLSGS